MISKTIKSYLYWQYNDDVNLQAFINAYNVMTQEYIDWFFNIYLPCYTQPQISGSLLDWVGLGLYGLSRPSIGVFINILYGTYNSYQFNVAEYNSSSDVVNYTLTDDQYKRLITWHFFKGDGKYFSIPWLKRRIERFLLGQNGSNYDQPTYRISVSFLDETTVLINIINSVFTVLINSGTYNSFQFNSFASEFNSGLNYNIINLTPVDNVAFLKTAIDANILELPFQFNYVVAGG